MNEWEEMEQLEHLIRTSSVPDMREEEEGVDVQMQESVGMRSQRFQAISTLCASVIIGLLLGLTLISIIAPIALKK
jgi:hypothetical protein